MNVNLPALLLSLTGMAVGALSVVMLRAWVRYLKQTFRRATEPGEIADERKRHRVAKALIADFIAIGFIAGIACFAAMTCGWCYISAFLFGSWTMGVASVCAGAWAMILYFWGPLLSGLDTQKRPRS